MSSHAGLMALTRAMSLSEVSLARMAAAWFKDPEKVTFADGKVWNRELEDAFYWSCLVTPFRTGSNGFRALREMRDMYVHGYGIPVTNESRVTLAQRLYEAFGDAEPTTAEIELGYKGAAYYFGEYTKYVPSTKTLESTMLSAGGADLSPLATYRSMVRIREHIAAAYESLSHGLLDDISETAFAKIIERNEERKAKAEAARKL